MSCCCILFPHFLQLFHSARHHLLLEGIPAGHQSDGELREDSQGGNPFIAKLAGCWAPTVWDLASCDLL